MAENMTRGTDLQGLSPSQRAAAVEAAEERVRRLARANAEAGKVGTGIDPAAAARSGDAVANATTPNPIER